MLKRKNSWILLVMSLMVLCLMGRIEPINAWNNGFDQTPAMGWNSWYGYYMNPTETLIKQIADAMVSRGFKTAGYTYCNIDDGWMASTRDGSGNLRGDATKFPSGMKALTDYVHSKGLKFGLYECAGTSTCGGLPGCYGHYQQDANQYAVWGIDHLKLDWCNTSGLDPQTQYTQMRDAIINSGHLMNFNMCEWGVNSPWLWSEPIANSWRIAGDSGDSWAHIMQQLDVNAPLSQYAGAGHWNDPDYLMAGLGGCTYDEYKSQFSLWCIMAAPLFISANVATLSQTYVDMLTNPEVIAVDQDSACVQGSRVVQNGTSEVWRKPLGTSGTTKAVALLNRGSSTTNITVNWSDIGLASGNATVRDLWARADMGTYINSYTASVPPHGTVMLKIAGTASVNLALNATASASSIWGAGYEANKANDANMGTRWNTANGKFNNEWLKMDFGTGKDFNQVITRENPAFQRITAYKIQTSTDNTNWVDRVTGTTVGTNKIDNFATVNARYVRLYVTTASNCPTIDEFEVYNSGSGPTPTPTPTPSVNLAIGKTASASSYYGAGYEASKSNDNNMSTRWNAQAGTGAGQWLRIDFGTATTFNKTVIYQDFNRILGYKIQSSTDGTNWTDRVTGGAMGTGGKTDTFAAVSARYIRMYVTSAQSDGGGPDPTIWEFQVYNQ